MVTKKEIRSLSTMPPPRNSGFSLVKPATDPIGVKAEEAAEFYRSLHEVSAECIFVCDLAGALLRANRRALEMFGIVESELPGASFTSMIPQAQVPRFLASLREAAESGCTEEIQRLNLRTRDGRQVILASRSSAFMIGAEPLSVLHVARDVSDFFTLQDELKRDAALAAAGQVAGKAGHDIRNLLVPASSLIEYLLETDESKLTPARIGGLKRIAASAKEAMDNITHLISHLMILSAPGPKSVVDVDVNPILRVMADRIAVALEARKEKFSVQLDLCEDPRIVRGDRVELDRAFMNIAANAIDAMPSGGRLTIRTANDDSESQPMIRIAISDTGCGMNEEVMSRMFDPHFSTKGSRGNGLGLAITSKTVKDHGGIIRVSSEEGHGTSFEVLLPAKQP